MPVPGVIGLNIALIPGQAKGRDGELNDKEIEVGVGGESLHRHLHHLYGPQRDHVDFALGVWQAGRRSPGHDHVKVQVRLPGHVYVQVQLRLRGRAGGVRGAWPGEYAKGEQSCGQDANEAVSTVCVLHERSPYASERFKA